MVTSYSRGHEIYYDGKDWRYADNNEILNEMRPCKRCGRTPTKEGYDACVGYIEGATSVCCGHGVEEPHIMIGGEVVTLTRSDTMCEYQRINPTNEKELPRCAATNEICTFCVLGNAKTYNEIKRLEKSQETLGSVENG